MTTPAANPILTENGLREALTGLAAQLVGDSAMDPRRLSLERPPRAEFGDYSTNAALLLAPAAGSSPRELAQRLGEAAAGLLGTQLDRFEVAGPGFLNLFLSDSWHAAALGEALSAGEPFGGGGAGRPERIVVEFVSANPTGPMHVGHARNAAYGDSLARLLAFHGHQVEREFYVNDAGSQIRKLGESIRALARGEQVPEDGYRGDYVRELLASLPEAALPSSEAPAEGAAPAPAAGGTPAEGTAPAAGEAQASGGARASEDMQLGRVAAGLMLERIREALERFNVEGFHHWQSESELHSPREDLPAADGTPLSPVAHALELLAERRCTYEKDGAVWLESTRYGDDKDRVLVRSNGEHTYFASDIAYHQDKRERGFQRQIDVWGADHHGYLARMRAAYEALGGDPSELEMLIMQLVHLVRRGERAQMSKRAGEFVTLEDLIAEIGVDAARWFLLSRSHDTTIDLDLDLAREQSSENPVYYVQYAHARIASMLDKAGEARVRQALDEALALRMTASTGAQALHHAERALVKKLVAFPGELSEAASRRAPHRVAAYALELAQEFTAFYRDCRVVGAEPRAVESLRVALCVATQRTLARSLGLLGVSAPSQM